MRPSLVAMTLLAGLTAATAAEGDSVPAAFAAACLVGAGEPAGMAAYADRIGAAAEPDPDLLGMLPPLVIADRVERWLRGDPMAKAADDLLLVHAPGMVADKPADGCMVLGRGEPGAAQQALALFDAAEPLGKATSTILPPYQYWLVDTPTGPAIFGAAEIAARDADSTSLILALVRVDPAVIDQLRQDF